MTKANRELSPEEIIFTIPEETVSRLRKLKRRTDIIGQERAVCAIDLGLSINAPGYNIYIMGASGTGRRTVLASLLEKYKVNQDDLQDIAYVYNFERPLEPRSIFFPPGQGNLFKKDLRSAVENVRIKISQMVKSEDFSKEREKILQDAEVEGTDAQEGGAQADSSAADTQQAVSQNTVPETYVVQQGDTLLKISRKIYGNDDQIDAICSLNGIDDSDHILAGQKLLLP